MKPSLLFIAVMIFALFSIPTSQIIGQGKDVSFTTTDGVLLKGTFFSSKKQEAPGILLMHQCMDGSNRSMWKNVAQSLSAKGYSVLTFDFRGYGDSEGEWPEFNDMSEFINISRNIVSKDVNAAYEFLKSQEEVSSDKMGLGGASCGVFMGIDLAFEHKEINTMVLLSGPFDTTAKERLATMSQVPVFSAASEKDTRAFEAMKRVFSTTTNPNSILIQLKGDRHGTFMFETDPDMQDRIAQWFARWL